MPDTDTTITPWGVVKILLIVVLLIALIGGATALWGLPALGLAGLALVPVAWVVLIMLSVGK